MPTNRRKRTQLRRGEVTVLTPGQRFHLETGQHFGDGFGTDRDAFEASWEEHGETILAEFIAANPGRRPFAWWLLDHGQERPVTALDVPAYQLDAMRHDTRRGCTFGMLHCSWAQEDETSYLARQGLLTPAERQLLATK